MTISREEFIKEWCKDKGVVYEERFGLSGYISYPSGWEMLALPCACGSDLCEGWGMVSVQSFDDHMRFHSPEELRQAYLKLVPL